MVGEVFLLSTDAVATYYGHDDELHLAFNFPPLFAPWLADRWRGCIEDDQRALDPRGAWPTWVLSNHDNPRHRTRYDRAAARAGEDAATTARRSEARARAAAVLLLTLRGTPFVYQGDELGLRTPTSPRTAGSTPGAGRCRAPIPWDGTADHGWPTARRRRDLAAVPPGGRPPQPGGAGRRPRTRSSTSTGGPSPCGGRRRRSCSATFALLDVARRASSPTDGRSAATSCTVLVNFTGEAVDVSGRRTGRCRGAAGLRRPGPDGRGWPGCSAGPGGRAATG